MAVLIYRELSPEMPSFVTEWLDARGQLIEVEDKKGNTHFIVENDVPRDPEITEAIVGPPGCTIGFGVYDDEGNRIGMYATVGRAEEAADKARVVTAESDEGMEWDSIDADA
jgi:hypothetical protein